MTQLLLLSLLVIIIRKIIGKKKINLFGLEIWSRFVLPLGFLIRQLPKIYFYIHPKLFEGHLYVKVLEWSSQSSDLNLVENLLKEVNVNIHAHKPQFE